MFMDAVWAALPEMEWASTRSIREAADLDEEKFNAILNFLIRWKFIETRTAPESSVRRRADVPSPVDVVGALQTLTDAETEFQVSEERFRVAERVACRLCGHRNFTFLKRNLVECNRCHERQWHTIEAGTAYPKAGRGELHSIL